MGCWSENEGDLVEIIGKLIQLIFCEIRSQNDLMQWLEAANNSIEYGEVGENYF